MAYCGKRIGLDTPFIARWETVAFMLKEYKSLDDFETNFAFSLISEFLTAGACESSPQQTHGLAVHFLL